MSLVQLITWCYFRLDPPPSLLWIICLLLITPNILGKHSDPNGSSMSGLKVSYYHLSIDIDFKQKTIRGSNRIHGTCKLSEPLLIDLTPYLQVDSIVRSNEGLQNFRRDTKGQIRVALSHDLTAADTLTIYYNGAPPKAKKAPWDGGFVWTQDGSGKPWVGVACQGIGASVWWPLRDDLHAEPDSMRISIRIPTGLMAVSNGNLESVDHHTDSTSTWTWLVSYPINPYNVTLNVADYVHIRDNYSGMEGNLALDYYVLRANESKAIKHFKQVHTLLDCFERKLGPYPFYRDGYALVETPYWGMEHQSCVAYGNNYIDNEWGFDFIIVHETGHEWFGNNMSAPDNAELWIHESLTTYAEAIYVECIQGREAASTYLYGHRKRIVNKEPMLGPLGVKFNDRKTSDIYYKGAWVWHTIRTTLDNDSLWWKMVRGIRDTFRLSIVNTPQLIAYVNRQTGINWNNIFDLYLNSNQLPVFEYRFVKTGTKESYIDYRWVLPKGYESFDLPLRLRGSDSSTLRLIHPKTNWKREPWPLPESIDPFPSACKDLLIECKKVD